MAGSRTRTLALWAAALIAVSSSVVAEYRSPAHAITGADWNAGYIISDERFFDNGSMTESQIQEFLSARVPRCASTDSTLPCLPSLVTSTSDRAAAANGCGAYASEGWESSARILWKVAQACRINAQVLIVMLQKEQGLVTSTRPTLRQYQAAMGADCPDTAPCAATTLGFFNQVYKAAWQMRQYTYSPNSWRHRIGPTDILYSPAADCGSSRVDIRNQATANLYNYTPYQPNAAALANLTGTGDRCSTYGNRNFWVFFSNWFGSTTASGTTQIDTLYASLGGVSGVLGNPTSDYIAISTVAGAGTGRAYEGGSIYWSDRTGTAAVIEPFRAFYFGYDGATGRLGWPNSQSAPIAGRPGGAGQSFLYGSVYMSDSTGIHSVIGDIRDIYFAQGGATGWLGWPTVEARSATSAATRPIAGSLQDFEGGAIASAPGVGTYALPTAISATYLAQGGPGSTLGWPTSFTYDYAVNGGGSGQVFEGGSIFASAAGSFAVSGPVRDVYFQAGGAAGYLGWPTSALTAIAQNGGGSGQAFASGSIYAKPSVGTFAVGGAIRQVYWAQGGAAGALGFPTSIEVAIAANGGGAGQAFENGSVYSSAAGTYWVSEPIRTPYFAQGGAVGVLGWPTGPMTCSGGTCSQPFQGGTLTY